MQRALSFGFLTCLALFAAGCTQFPALDRTITPELEAAPYPALVPLPPLMNEVGQSGGHGTAVAASLEARVARLRARAARLQNAGLTGRERQRLQNGLS